MKLKLALLFICVAGVVSFFSLRSSSTELPQDQAPILTATGIYFNGTTTRPLLLNLIKKSNFYFWSGVKAYNINLPTDMNIASNAGLKSVSCQEDSCIAVGEYPTTSAPGRPLILSSSNRKTWSAVEASAIELPDDTDRFAILEAVSCINDNCTAAGFYTTAQHFSRLLLLNSKKAEKDWRLAKSITLPNDMNANGDASLLALNCNASSCVAAGEYLNSEALPRPLILIQSKNGKNWQAVNANSIKLPSDIQPHAVAILRSVSCHGAHCVAVGFYGVNVTNRPLILMSSDYGAFWTGVNADKINLPDDLSGKAELNAIYCDNTTCIAGGFYEINNGSVALPLLIVNSNYGAKWQSNDNVSLPVDLDPTEDAIVASLTCQGAECVGAGTYTNMLDFGRPLLLHSKNHGKTWQAANADRVTLPPNIAGYTLLHSVD